MPPDKYFICDNGFLDKVVGEDDRLFHMLVVPSALSKYILPQVYDALEQTGIFRFY